MKKQLLRALLLCTLAGVMLVSAVQPGTAAPLPRWSTGQREIVRDAVGSHKDGRAAGIIGSTVPKTGTVRVLVIPVEFAPDTDLATSGTGVMPYKSWGPAAQTGYLADRLTKLSTYIAKISQNKVTLLTIPVGKVTLDKQMANYSNLATGSTAMMTEVIAKADSRINFAQADIIMLVHAGAGREMSVDYDNSKDIHSHSMQLPDANAIATADGVKVGGYLVMPETECHDDYLRLANANLDLLAYENGTATYPGMFVPHYYDVLGVWAHEMCHAFGMADVYDVNYDQGLSLHNWSLMASGSYLPEPPEGAAPWTVRYDPTKPLYGSVPSHPDPWNKQLLGWATIVNVTEPRLSEVIRHQEDTGSVIYRMWTNGLTGSNEYFLVENRQQTGYDRYVPENGLMIYHIDEWAGSYALNELQIDGTHPRIYPLSADDTLEVDGWGSFIPGRETTFPGAAANRHVGANTLPSSRDYAGRVTLVDIDAITAIGNTVTADLRVTRPVDMVFESPENQSTIYVTRPTVRIWAPKYDPASFSVTVNGQPSSPPVYNAATGELTIALGSPIPLAMGQYTVVVTGKPLTQITTVSATLVFTVKPMQLPAGLSFFSLPVLNVGTTSQVFAGQSALQLAVYDPALNAYRRYPDTATEFASTGAGAVDHETGIPVTPAGKGYWIRLPSTTTLSLPGDITNSGHQYAVTTQQGFNMIGNPYHFPVALNSLLVEHGGKLYSVREAAALRLIEPVLYGWNGSGYTMVNSLEGVLQPWSGYWLLSYQPVKVIFQPMKASSVVSSMATRGRAVADGWEIVLKAQSTTIPYKAEVRIGVQAGATRGVDAGRDVLAPPPAPIGVGLVSRATQPLWYDYREDNTNQSWELQVSGEPGSAVIVSWPDLLRLPRNYQLTLRDPVTGIDRYLRTTASYTVQFGARESARTLYLVASPTSIGDLRIGSLAAHRTRTAGNVTISGSLTQSARLTVEIRTMTGRLVRRLPEATRAQGAFSLTWDGRAADGHVLPKGMYQCQVLATAPDGKSVKAVTVLPQ